MPDNAVARRPLPPKLPAENPASAALFFLIRAVVMAAAAAAFFILAGSAAVLLVYLALRHRRSRRWHAHTLHPAPAIGGLSPSSIQLLPFFLLETTPAAVTCAVCLEDGVRGEAWRALTACKHKFHLDCIDQWLVKSPRCPICRGAVIPANRAASIHRICSLSAAVTSVTYA